MIEEGSGTALGINLDPQAKTPLHRQLQEAIAERIRHGTLTAGERLPSVRGLAAGLGVAPITVSQAYDALKSSGLVAGQAGRGTFVQKPPQTLNESEIFGKPASLSMLPDSEWRTTLLAGLSDGMSRADICRQQQRPALTPGVIHLASGSPDPQLFPIAAFQKAFGHALDGIGDSPLSLQYGPPYGDPGLRTWLADYFSTFGFAPQPDEIIITTGAQRAIDIVATALLSPGDTVLVESPGYIYGYDIFEGRGARLLPVPMDENGVQVDLLPPLLERYAPRLLYCVPTAHSPTGVTLSAERRAKLVALAERYNFLIVEDDVANEFFYEDSPPPPLKTLDRQGRVIYLKSFSKLVFPALRVGALVVPEWLMARVAEIEQRYDRFTSLPVQRALHQYLSSNAFPRVVAVARTEYLRRRDTVLAALDAHVPPELGVRWWRPQNGLSMALRLPIGMRGVDVWQAGVRRDVVVTAGAHFYAGGANEGRPDLVRVTYGDNPPQVLEEGIRQLGAALREVAQVGQSRRSLDDNDYFPAA